MRGELLQAISEIWWLDHVRSAPLILAVTMGYHGESWWKLEEMEDALQSLPMPVILNLAAEEESDHFASDVGRITADMWYKPFPNGPFVQVMWLKQ